MKKWTRGLKRGLLITAIVLTIIVVVVIAFISPITKYVVEKYSEKYLGRKITMSWAYVNPFTGNVHFHNIKIYENKSDTVFFAADGISAGFALRKLPFKTYEITGLSLNHPWGVVVQNRSRFNFSDLIERFTPKSSPDTTKPPTHFNLLNIEIKEGEFHYVEEVVGINYYVKNVNINSKGLRWDVDSIVAKVSLESGPAKGDIKADLSLNLKNMDYRLGAIINKFDLDLIGQYVKAIANYGSFRANLDANIKAVGNLKSTTNLAASGNIAINDFHYGKTPTEDYASFEKFQMEIVELNPAEFKYTIDTVMLNKPFFKYERYDELDNLQQMFGAKGSNISAAKADSSKVNILFKIADFLSDLGKNFIQSYFKVQKVAIYAGNFKFNDFSLREEFSVAANPLYLLADSIDRNYERLNAHVRSGIKPYGYLSADLSFDPNDADYFDLSYSIQKIPLAMFNPYVVSYTSFPLDKGTFEFKGGIDVNAGVIKSGNHLLIIDPRTDKRIKKNDTKWIPVPLILSIVRERGGAIDYELPIGGNLKDPKFNFWNVALHVIENIFIKPPSTPYLVHVNHVETQLEKSLAIKWQERQNTLRPLQEKFVERMADFLKSNADASITVVPLEYADKEKEQLLFFEARKKYFLLTHNLKSLSEEDSLLVDKMSVKDSAFVRYLTKRIGDTLMFTIQEKCRYFLGEGVVNAKYAQLLKSRQNTFDSYFKKLGVDGRVTVKASETGIPYNGFSYYKIDYKGEFPEKLMKIYREMNDINEENPRKKFDMERRKNGGTLVEAKEVKEK